jgi:hypothetical protein
MMFATCFTRRICCSQYAHNFVMRTGIPICKYFSNPRLYAYGDPHMRMAIPICIILHMGIQDLISHMETISLCIRLVTEISPYAYRHLTNPCMHTEISVMLSPYAYGDLQYPLCLQEKLAQMLLGQIESDGKNCFLPLKLSFFYLYEHLLKEVKSEDFGSN